MMRPLLSIVIPTKDRYCYLKYLIDYFISLRYDAIELIIQDNSFDNKEIIEYLYSFGADNRIKYEHHAGHLPLKDNCDLAVSRATGKYVLMIGDDDCFLPSLTDAVQEIERMHCEAMVCPRLTYIWPDAEKYITYLSTDMTLRCYSRKRVFCDAKQELGKVLKAGGQTMLNLPRLYHGIVHTDVLKKLWNLHGTFFPGPSPDMANAVALALFGTKTICIDYPFIIAGTGYMRIKGNEKGDRKTIKEASFLPDDAEKIWSEQIPRLWTTPTVYAQTVWQIVHAISPDILSEFNWNAFYSTFGADFFLDFAKAVPSKTCLKLFPSILYKKVKRTMYRNFKSEINLLRGYRKYLLDSSSAGNYAISVQREIGAYHEIE